MVFAHSGVIGWVEGLRHLMVAAAVVSILVGLGFSIDPAAVFLGGGVGGDHWSWSFGCDFGASCICPSPCQIWPSPWASWVAWHPWTRRTMATGSFCASLLCAAALHVTPLVTSHPAPCHCLSAPPFCHRFSQTPTSVTEPPTQGPSAHGGLCRKT